MPRAGRRRVAVVGAGWAGLAAAVEATRRGHELHLFDLSSQAGGRARTLPHQDRALDNGQHILIGAYRDTLALMRQVGVDPAQVLERQRLTVVYPDGAGLRLPPGPTQLAFAWGVLRWPGWRWADRLSLLRAAVSWRLGGFSCPPDWTVARLCQGLSPRVRDELIEPLSIAALNTPADRASARVLLTVLRDALFGPAGSADLLLPRAPLDALLPAPATRWLQAQGAHLHLGHRVQQLQALTDGRWQIDALPVDAVVVATSAPEAARLLAPLAPEWAARAAALRFEPIVTVWLKAPQARRWPEPMLAVHPSADAINEAPAQFAFDLGALGGEAGLYTAVISGAAPWVARGLDATGEATRRQLARALCAKPGWRDTDIEVVAVRADKRATFACTPQAQRPGALPCPAHPTLQVAGDYVAGPYPATLEGAVRSGLAAATALGRASGSLCSRRRTHIAATLRCETRFAMQKCSICPA